MAGTVIALTDFKYQAIGYIILALMVPVSLWTFWAQLKQIRGYLWPVGGTVTLGLLLGAIGWSLYDLLYGVLIALAAWALAQAGFAVWIIKKQGQRA